MDRSNISAPNETLYDCKTDDEWKVLSEEIAQLSWWLGDVGLPTVTCFGIFLDLMAISILQTEKLKCNFKNIQCFLSIMDILFLVSSTLYHVLNKDTNIHPSLWTATLLLYVIGPLQGMSMYASIYITLAMSYDRYKAISKPQEYRIQERVVSSSTCGELTLPITYAIKVLVPSVVFYFPQFFIFEIRQDTSFCDSKNLNSMGTSNQNISCNTVHYSVHATELRTNEHFNLWYLNVGNFTFTIALPLLLMIVLNGITYFKIKDFRKRQRNSQRQASKQIDMAYQLFAFVFLFTFCHAFRITLNILEYFSVNTELNFCEPPRAITSLWLRLANTPISSFMISFFAFANFFLLALFSKDFNTTLKEMLANLVTCFRMPQLGWFNRNVDADFNTNDPNFTNAIEMGSMGQQPQQPTTNNPNATNAIEMESTRDEPNIECLI